MEEFKRGRIFELLHSIQKQVESKSKSIKDKKEEYFKTLKFYVESNLFGYDLDLEKEYEDIDELITNYFLDTKIEEPKVFESDGYHPWLEDARSSINFQFWRRYEKYLFKEKNWSAQSVNNINRISDVVLDHIANPKNSNYFAIRGLVMGDIQSGKTANYTALVNKAIDAGYKLIIILAGLTKELRNQTQGRLDSEVRGYISSGPKKGAVVGVGSIEKTSINVDALTIADDENSFGDLKKFFGMHTLDEKMTPKIAIVKKNTSVLTHLHDFIKGTGEDCFENGKLRIPVLIIDDEVDQASVDTKGADTVDKASTINKKIRLILDLFNRYSYVGYTATPFANVFIDPDEKKNDLYPKDFILYMYPSNGYCGIKEYFGVDIDDEVEDQADHTPQLFKEITSEDYRRLFDSGNLDKYTSAVSLNDSLKDAIQNYILACAIKRSRGMEKANSMLIHIARFRNSSNTLRDVVRDYVSELQRNLQWGYEDEIQKYKERWEKEFEPISRMRLGDKYKDSWPEIEKCIDGVIYSIQLRVMVINGDSDDVLDYENDKGCYIVIGGDKLSRGLTLEGLCVSYYWRNSKNYDSLLQMGRWFGYRNGWLDVCRIYTSRKAMTNFLAVGKVLERFKLDLANMYNERLNPRDVGQRIMYSPNLLPTSYSKMRDVKKQKVSFSNEVQQIISFDKKSIKPNFDMTLNFINSLGEPTYVTESHKLVYKDRSVHEVLKYLEDYKEVNDFYDYGQINIRNWINYIQNLSSKGELKYWTIVVSSVMGRDHEKKVDLLNGKYSIYKRKRSLRDFGRYEASNILTVKTITDPRDFKEALDHNDPDYEKTEYFNKKLDYKTFNEKTGLLSLYVFDLHEKIKTGEINPKTCVEKTTKSEEPIPDGINVTAPAIWFPKTKDYENSAVSYFVSKDYLSKHPEFGGPDDDDDEED